MTTKVSIGQRIAIPVGKQVNRAGQATRQKRPSIVTVRKTEPARNGKTRVYWTSMGYSASALF